jgi:UDP-N-acetylmuramyl pentapeptide synthase
LIAIVIDRGAFSGVTADDPKPGIIVRHDFDSLVRIALYKQSLFNGEVIAITGSCGKTITRGFIKSMCVFFAVIRSAEEN